MTTTADAIKLSPQHLEAVNRPRRIVQNFDSGLIDPDTYEGIDAIVADKFAFIDDADTYTDSIWWNWGNGNVVVYPSKFLPTYNVPGYRRWIEQGINIVSVFQQETRKRGLEGFYSMRMNAGDQDPQWDEQRGAFQDDMDRQYRIPQKEAHPDWLIKVPYNKNGLWNYGVEGVRQYVVAKLREVAEMVDLDGLELDFARGCPVLPPGEGWLLRDAMTDLIRRVRLMTMEIAEQRGRPLLLAARVPENLMGCHFDGFEVERWAAQRLVDILVMGCRNFEVDIAAFRRITAGTPIKLYCALDDHHSSDGYAAPPIEVLRGVIANWYHQGTDGVQTFNFMYAPDPGTLHWPMHLQLYKEMGDPEKLRPLDKTFVVSRRGGGHGAMVIADPEDWSTPRRMFSNTNMLCQLPVPLDNGCKADALLTLYVADDVNGEAERVREITLHVLLNDPAAANLPDDARLPVVIVRDCKVPLRDGGPPPENIPNSPPTKGIEKQFEVRINNLLLDPAHVDDGWLIFNVKPVQLAVGQNLLGMRLTQRDADATDAMLIEKVELHVKYGGEEV